MATELKLPELAEGVESATVVNVLVAVGDVVAVDQPVLEVETDKAAAEVPSTLAGTVTEIKAEAGQTLSVGDVILLVEEGAEAPAKEETTPPESEPEPEPEPKPKAVVPQEPPAPAAPKPQAAPAAKAAGTAIAAPSVRRLAREIGVDVNEVPGSGAGGRVTQEDVKAYARQVNVEVPGAGVRKAAAVATGAAKSDTLRFGEVERVEMSGVRRRTAQNMTMAWTTIPHVTQHDKADVTELESFRKQYGKRVEAAGGKLTVTAILVKVVAEALKRFPQFNASVDMDKAEVVYKKFCNIGVAVDTDRGLLVPVLRDADQKSVTEIAVEMGEMAERARTRKTQLDELQGGTFTISNLGGIGGTAFTPIINPPEVAILGVSRSRIEPVFADGQFQPRMMLPFSLAYDHRVIDGADGARFLRWIVEVLEQPLAMLLEA